MFFPLNRETIVNWGENGEHKVELNQWDRISVPSGLMRGFRNANEHTLLVYSVVGGTDADAGRITWHPGVIKAADATGLALDRDGCRDPKSAVHAGAANSQVRDHGV